MKILNFFYGIMFIQASGSLLDNVVDVIIESKKNEECSLRDINGEYQSVTLDLLRDEKIIIKYHVICNNGFKQSVQKRERVFCKNKTIENIILEIEGSILRMPIIDNSKPFILTYNKDHLEKEVNHSKGITWNNIIKEIEKMNSKRKKEKGQLFFQNICDRKSYIRDACSQMTTIQYATKHNLCIPESYIRVHDHCIRFRINIKNKICFFELNIRKLADSTNVVLIDEKK
ncbi:putative SP-containing protein [Vairimorpha necatrix]|uniref:SP-containing protein n=1 Tax=Vairimorpha necatrix TaxID=6039 RepID=A0AAX4JE66_9MICR